MSENRKLTIAACQHDVGANVRSNLAEITGQVKLAKSWNADIVHFSECNLTGYGGIDLLEINKESFGEVQYAIQCIQELAGKHAIGVIIGTHFFENEETKPKNSLLYINQSGRIEAHYSKRILTGKEGDLEHRYYEGGEQPVVFNLKGIKCGMLICHEWRYPEFYREYKKLGAEIIFHSWYDGGLDHQGYLREGSHTGELIVGAVKGYAANNYLWVSGSNTSNKESCFPSFIVRPDGQMMGEMTRNQPGVLIRQLDLDLEYEDPSLYGRRRFLK